MFVSSSSSPGGGGELYIHKLANELKDANDVLAAYSADPSFNGLAKEATTSGCSVIRFPYLRIYDRPLRSLGLYVTGTKCHLPSQLLKEVDVIHVSQQNVEDGIDLVHWIGIRFPAKTFATIHMVQPLSSMGQQLGTIRQSFPRYTYNKLKESLRMVFVADAAQTEFRSMFGFLPTHRQVIRNGAESGIPPASAPASLRAKLGIPTEAFVFGSVGRIEEQKNYKCLVQALSVLTRNSKNAYLLLVGDGSQRQQILREAESLALRNRVVITGWTNNPLEYYAVFDAFVLPSLFEGFPFALVEALHADRPCIASNIAPNRECLLSQAPLLFAPHDIDALAKKLHMIASGDSEVLDAVAKAVLNAKATLTQEQMAIQTLRFYRTASSV